MTVKGLALFDIDGVIRDVSQSYRLAVQHTVRKFCGWLPNNKEIDSLKSEGCWNNDWDVSLELIKRHIDLKGLSTKIPFQKDLIKEFNNFYFGDVPSSNPKNWNGFIRNETLLVDKKLFERLSELEIAWGFVSGAETASAKFVLENRIGLKKPPLIAMEDAPEKPDPTGLIHLSEILMSEPLGVSAPPIAYLGDTVADVLTVMEARKELPTQKFISLAVAPPHLHSIENLSDRRFYETQLKNAGADEILSSTNDFVDCFLNLSKISRL